MKKLPSEVSTGGAERAKTILSTDQPFKIASVKVLILGLGIVYVKPAENWCRISKSEDDLLPFVGPDGSNALDIDPGDPAEALSMECDHV